MNKNKNKNKFNIIALSLVVGFLSTTSSYALDKETKSMVDESTLNESTLNSIPKEGINENAKHRSTIKRLQHFPISGLAMIQDESGIDKIVSDNGRFIFEGVVTDTWSGKQIKSFDDIATLNKLPMEKIGKAFDGELASFSLGTGTKNIYVFIDPYCPICHEILQKTKEIKDKKEYKDFKFNFVYMPVLGQKSEMATVALFCEKPVDVAERILEGRFSDLKPKEDCKLKMDALQKNLAVGQILGLKGVPYIIRWDGEFVSGSPKSFEEWLLAGKK
jgi:thiol:disulfide interchange protein DsbC